MCLPPALDFHLLPREYLYRIFRTILEGLRYRHIVFLGDLQRYTSKLLVVKLPGQFLLHFHSLTLITGRGQAFATAWMTDRNKHDKAHS